MTRLSRQAVTLRLEQRKSALDPIEYQALRRSFERVTTEGITTPELSLWCRHLACLPVDIVDLEAFS